MNIEQIIEKYLPMMQNLQQTVAGRKQLSMEILVSGNYLLVDVTTYRNNDGETDFGDYVHEYFYEGYSEKEMDDKFLTISAFTASHLITKPAEAELVTNISNN